MAARSAPVMRPLLLAALLLGLSSRPTSAVLSTSNPIRKVVTMLQKMQEQVRDEGELADKLFDKFMCYCKHGTKDIEVTINHLQAEVKELPPDIKVDESKKKQLVEAMTSHKNGRIAAVKSVKEAAVIREKERIAYEKEVTEANITISALGEAIGFLKKGSASSSFLQTQAATVLGTYLETNKFSLTPERQDALSFVCSKEGVENSEMDNGEVIGILSVISQEMVKDRKVLMHDEKAAVADFEGLKRAKDLEQTALAAAMETGLERAAELGIDLSYLNHELEDALKSLNEDEAFMTDLQKNCATRGQVHQEEQNMRAQEQVALSGTIKMLNSDEALDLFKKALPSASSSFLQLQSTTASMRAQARSIVVQARQKLGKRAVQLDFISLALHGKKFGLNEVSTMIDEIIVTLKTEQKGDDQKKEWCTKEFDTAEDKTKALQRRHDDLVTAQEATQEDISTLKEDIQALTQGIVKLDKSVAAATLQRKEENAEFKKRNALSAAAKDLIRKARDHMGKFYASAALTQETSGDAPPAPPAATAAYKKKDAGGGAMAMMQTLINDLEKEMLLSESEEKSAQQEYELTMKDSAEKRALDSKSAHDKEADTAEVQRELETSKADSKAVGKELKAASQYLMELHGDCDWLMENYKTRQEARTEEIESLIMAKEVINAVETSVSFVEVSASRARTRKFLRPRMA